MRQRQRTKSFEVPVNLLEKTAFLDPVMPNPSYIDRDTSTTIPQLAQRMIDEPQRVHNTQDCFNVRSELVLGGYLPDFGASNKERINSYSHYATPATNQVVESPTLAILNRALPYAPDFMAPVDWRSALRRAGYANWVRDGWRKPKLTLYSGFSLLNFLLEWKELPRMIKHWTDHKVLIKRYHLLKAGNVRLGQRAQALANERLAHVYGTQLFLQDARFLFDALTGINEKVARFLLVCGSVQRVYKRTPLRLSFSRTLGTRLFPLFGSENSRLWVTETLNLEARACLYYEADVPAFKGSWTRLMQLCDAFGVRIDAGILWDAIPMSFVVDWYINVSDWLHSNWSMNGFQLDLSYIDFCHSAKVRSDRTLWWGRTSKTGVITYGDCEDALCSRTTTIYRRKGGQSPPNLQRPTLQASIKPWKLGRWLNAIALVSQRAHLPARKLAKGFYGYAD